MSLQEWLKGAVDWLQHISSQLQIDPTRYQKFRNCEAKCRKHTTNLIGMTKSESTGRRKSRQKWDCNTQATKRTKDLKEWFGSLANRAKDIATEVKIRSSRLFKASQRFGSVREVRQQFRNEFSHGSNNQSNVDYQEQQECVRC